MRSLSTILRYLFVLLGLGLIAILAFLYKIGVFSALPLLQLRVPDGPLLPHMYELRELYERGSGIDDAVDLFVKKHAELYIEPTITLLQQPDPSLDDEEVALFFAGRYSGDCRIRVALLEHVLSSESRSMRSMVLSLMHQSWDEVEIGADPSSGIKASFISFHEEPAIDQPPDAWRNFGAMQYQGFVDEHNDYPAAMQFAASQLSSPDRLELMHWLEAVSSTAPSNAQVARALSESGSDYYVMIDEPGEVGFSTHLAEIGEWVAEAELKAASENCYQRNGVEQ